MNYREPEDDEPKQEFIDPNRRDIMVIPMYWGEAYHYVFFGTTVGSGNHEEDLLKFCESVNMNRRQGLHCLLFMCVLFNCEKHQSLLDWLLRWFGHELDFSKHIVHALPATSADLHLSNAGVSPLIKGALTGRPLYIARFNKNAYAERAIMEFLLGKL